MSLNPLLSTTSVSPSQWPTEYPIQLGLGSVSKARPSMWIWRYVRSSLQDDDHRGSLKEPLRTSSGGVVRTLGQTFVMRVVHAEVFSALLNQRLRPRLNVGGLEVPGFAERDIADRRIARSSPTDP